MMAPYRHGRRHSTKTHPGVQHVQAVGTGRRKVALLTGMPSPPGDETVADRHNSANLAVKWRRAGGSSMIRSPRSDSRRRCSSVAASITKSMWLWV